MDNIPNLGDVLASARFVVERSHHVKIDQAAIDKAAPMVWKQLRGLFLRKNNTCPFFCEP
jgi:hypothetical protein